MKNYDKSIFDSSDLTQDVKRSLGLEIIRKDVFGDRIYRLFDIAKERNIHSLTLEEIVVAYDRMYNQRGKDNKSVNQIQAKLDKMVKDEAQYKKTHPEYRENILKKVPFDEKRYTIE